MIKPTSIINHTEEIKYIDTDVPNMVPRYLYVTIKETIDGCCAHQQD